MPSNGVFSLRKERREKLLQNNQSLWTFYLWDGKQLFIPRKAGYAADGM